MDESEIKKTARRDFLQAAASAMLGAPLIASCAEQRAALPSPTELQRAHKRKERSQVFTARVEGYGFDELASALAEGWRKVGPETKGKSVFLKPNLVDFRDNLPVFTDPAVLEAAIRYLQESGASEIKVGDGPALSRDTEEVAELTGIASVCRKNGVEFVDLNIDDLEKVENPLQFTEIKQFLLPRSVVKAELLISVPKLKTHHWALMTCSMKNMFGVIPGRKYGWPKNILHIKGINASVLDVVASAKPHFAIVDGITAMEGDGPLAGSARDLNLLAMGDDLVAVDTVCGMCMQIPVEQVAYLKIGAMVMGNGDPAQIDVIGVPVDSIKQKFVLPPTFEADGRPRNLSRLEKNSESGVT